MTLQRVFLAQSLRLMRALFDAAMRHSGAARAARTVLAPIWQHDAMAQTRVQDGLVGLDLKAAPTGQYRDLIAHLVESGGDSKNPNTSSLSLTQRRNQAQRRLARGPSQRAWCPLASPL
jgi:hypothetical protein